MGCLFQRCGQSRLASNVEIPGHNKGAQEVAEHAAKTAKQIRKEVLPILPQLERVLDAYIADYISRFMVMEKRKKSKLPMIVQDAVLGRISPTPCTVAEIQAMAHNLSITSRLFCKLSTFFDNLELYFRRLSMVNSRQSVLEYGYTFRDLGRLFQDRLIRRGIVLKIIRSWHPHSRTFEFSADEDWVRFWTRRTCRTMSL